MSAPRRQPQKPEFTTHPANGLAGRPLQSRICPQKGKEMLVSTSPRKNVKFPVHPVHSPSTPRPLRPPSPPRPPGSPHLRHERTEGAEFGP